ncbi:MAG: hypothetical protein WC526_04565 [Patescibacteria group bacterium]
MDNFAETKLGTIIGNIEPKDVQLVSRYISANLNSKFVKDFCIKYNLNKDQYNGLFPIALNYDKRTPQKTEEMINEELKNMTMNREMVGECLPYLAEEIRKNKLVETAKDAETLTRALITYFEFYKHTIGSVEGLDIYVIESEKEYSKGPTERDLFTEMDAENHKAKQEKPEPTKPEPEKEMAKVFDIKTGKRLQ